MNLCTKVDEMMEGNVFVVVLQSNRLHFVKEVKMKMTTNNTFSRLNTNMKGGRSRRKRPVYISVAISFGNDKCCVLQSLLVQYLRKMFSRFY